MADNSANGREIRNVLTQDEKAINDFINVRMKKVLADIKDLVEERSEDLIAWSFAFSYLCETYGQASDEPFKWYKYYLREGSIPASVQLPVLMQIYGDSSVDKGFPNILKKVYANEPAQDKERRISAMKKELAKYLDKDGRLCAYRGSFQKPFGTKNDESRPIEKAFSFSLDESAALHYAVCWFPASAQLYTVQVPLEEVMSYNLYEEDKPVVVLPQSKGGTFQVISQRDVDRSEYHSSEEEKYARHAYYTNFESRRS